VPHSSQADLDPKRFADALAHQMRERGLSQYGLADLVGVTQATISAWLNQRRLPSPESAQAALDALGLEWGDVVASPDSRSLTGDSSPAVSTSDIVFVPRNGYAGAAPSATEG